MINFDEKLKRLQEDLMEEFSITSNSLDEVVELFRLTQQKGVTWYSGDLVEPSGHIFEILKKKIQTYPEKRFVLNFRNGFDLKKKMTIFCTWEHR